MTLEEFLRVAVERAISEQLKARLPQVAQVDPLQFLSTDDVASLLGFDEATVRENMAKGKLPGAKVLGRWRVRRASLERFVQRIVRPEAHNREAQERVDADVADLAAAMNGRKAG